MKNDDLEKRSKIILHDFFKSEEHRNLFFKAATIPDAINLEISQINAEIILESFNSMGCNAFSPGP